MPPADDNSVMTYTIGPTLAGVFLPPIIPDDEIEDLLTLEMAPAPAAADHLPAEQLPPVLGVRFTAEDGEFDLSTLEIALNGEDVTHLFHPAGPDLDDILVGVFSPSTTPLREGTNWVEARVEGIPLGGTGLVADVDELTFEVPRLWW